MTTTNNEIEVGQVNCLVCGAPMQVLLINGMPEEECHPYGCEHEENTMTTIHQEPTTYAAVENLRARGLLIKHHTASARGYVSRKSTGVVSKYDGKFGTGYTVTFPRWDTTQYTFVTYYVHPK